MASATVYDTGWLDLDALDYITGNYVLAERYNPQTPEEMFTIMGAFCNKLICGWLEE